MALEKSVSLPANKRRYDSIATIIQGDATCGATCFDGRNLLLANNHALKSEFVDKILAYLKKVSQKCSERPSSSVFIKWAGQMKSELLAYTRIHIKLFQQNKTYASRFESALDKVTYSIYLAYHNPRDPAAISTKMAEIMRKGLFIFLEKKQQYKQGKAPHAELQIVDYLYSQRQNLFEQDEPIYVGVSKKCCGNCELAITALNQSKKSKVITIRGDGHGFHFLAGIPNFLKNNLQLQAIFLMLRSVSSLENAFVNDAGRISGDDQLLTPSSSIYEDPSIHESITFSLEEESSEVTIPLQTSSTAKMLKELKPDPTLPTPPPPRSPQKPKPKPKHDNKNKVEAKITPSKPKEKVSRSSLSAPALMFTPKNQNSTKDKKQTMSVKQKNGTKTKQKATGTKKSNNNPARKKPSR